MDQSIKKTDFKKLYSTREKEYLQGGNNNFLFYGLLVYIFIFYSQIAFRIPALAPFRVELIVGSILSFAAILQIIKGKIDFKENKLNSAALFFLMVAFITIPFAVWKLYALETFISLLKVFVIYIFIISAIDNEKKLKAFIYIYLGMISFMFLEPFILSLQGKGFIYNNYMWRLAGLTSQFGHPNQLGGITAANLPFFYYFMKYEKSIIGKTIFLLLIIIALWVITLTLSRTAFIGVIAVAFFIWIFSKKKFVSLIIIILCCVLIWHFAPQKTKDRFLTLNYTDEVITDVFTRSEAGSMAFRWTLMKHAWTLYTENPVLGVGLGNFQVVHLRRWYRWIPPHNTYLQALAEMGSVGFIAFFLFIIMIFKNLNNSKRLLKKIEEQNTFIAYIITAVTVYLLTQIVVSSFGISLYLNYWWVAGGLSLVILRVTKIKCQTSKEKES